MKTRWIIGGLAVIALLAVCVTGCGRKKEEPVPEKPEAKEVKVEEKKEKKPLVGIEKVRAMKVEAEKRGLKPGEYRIRHVKGKEPEIVEIPKLVPATGSGLQGKKIDPEYMKKLREKSKVRRDARMALHKVNSDIKARKVEIESSSSEYLALQSRIAQLSEELKTLQDQRNAILDKDEALNKLKEQVKPLEEASRKAEMELYAEIQKNKAEQRKKLLEEKERNSDATPEKPDFSLR